MIATLRIWVQVSPDHDFECRTLARAFEPDTPLSDVMAWAKWHGRGHASSDLVIIEDDPLEES